MVKIVNLAEYQKTIATRLRESASAPAAGARLGLEFGGANYLVEVGEFSEVAPNLEVTPVPFTRPWFLGITDIRGLIYGVIDMAIFTGAENTRNEASKHYVVSGSQFESRTALLVQRVLGLRRVEEWREVSPPPSAPPWIVASYLDEKGEPWWELSVRELVRHPDFLQIAQ